jgi:hypothetical protein
LVRTPRQGSWKLGSIPSQRQRGISSVGRAPALQAGCQEFESPILHWDLVPITLFNSIMSLLSQNDRQVVIAALENYIMKIRTESPQEDQRISQINALLNWVKLEYQKNS